MIGCGKCKGQHETTAQVRDCFAGAAPAADFQAQRKAATKEPAATDKQIAFLTKLLGERKHGYPQTAEYIAGVITSKKAASAAIEILLTLPKVATAAAPAVDVPEGMHAVDGKFVKVYTTKHGSNQKVGKVLVIDGQDDDGKYRCHFEYGGKRALKGLSEATKLTAEEAKQFGLLYGICVRCGLDLTKEESIHVGYGRTCAGHEGWWYPTKAELKAALAQVTA